MTVSPEVQAAVGGLALETSWLEFLAARLVLIAGDTKDEVALLKPQGKVFELARESAAARQDDSLRERTLDWLTRAQELQGERNRVIHSIAVFDHPGWYGLHPKSRTLVPTQEVLDLADEARRHADEGNYMGLFDWLHGSVRLATCSWASAGELTEERRLQTNRRSRLYVSCRLMASRLWPAGLGLANRTYIRYRWLCGTCLLGNECRRPRGRARGFRT